MPPIKNDELTEKIIACAFTVSNTLGSGFLEKVYENALTHELRKAGLLAEQQYPIQVIYDKISVGSFFADIFVENQILLELKTVENLTDLHMAQCINYLKATGLHICLLLNFHYPKVQIKRIVHNLPE